jgi:hypothetical protein
MPTCILNTTSQRHDLSQIPNPFGETRVLYATDILSTETGLKLPEAELHPVNRSTRLATPHPRFHSLSSAHEVLEKVGNCRRTVITCHAYAWIIFRELIFACLLSHSAFGSIPFAEIRFIVCIGLPRPSFTSQNPLRNTRKADTQSSMASRAGSAVPRQHTCELANSSLPQSPEPANETTTFALPSSENSTVPDSKYSQAGCPLFRVAPELRLAVYAHAMTPNIQSTARNSVGGSASVISLATAASSMPSKSLLLACRRIFNESGETYIDAQRAFWSSNTFTIELTTTINDISAGLPVSLSWLRAEALELMIRLVVSIEFERDTAGMLFTDESDTSHSARCWTISAAHDTNPSHLFAMLLRERQHLTRGLTKMQQLHVLLDQ